MSNIYYGGCYQEIHWRQKHEDTGKGAKVMKGNGLKRVKPVLVFIFSLLLVGIPSDANTEGGWTGYFCAWGRRNIKIIDLTSVTEPSSVPSPTNEPSHEPVVERPQFGLPQERYEAGIAVSISSPTEGATIRYTVDGSEPDETSEIYTEPLNISETTTIKARAFKMGMRPSETVTATYWIGEDPPWYDDRFKAVGYFPDWSGDKLDRIRFDIVTHINYAFAIPTADGTLRPLGNPRLARDLVAEAHKNNVKVLIAVGGWSYNGVPLESTFVQATSTDEKIQKLADSIIAMVEEYGFDGVDMDWEHPRYGKASQKQYEKLMLRLREILKSENKLLTAAVLGGVSPDGYVLRDAAAHTDAVLNAVDWINVMAYDGGDGEKHSSYDFAVNCALYWRDTRKMPAGKVVLGVPFYARPSWASYDQILQSDPEAYNTDTSMVKGVTDYYNGIPTIKAKTVWAMENVGGIMIWELSQDTTDESRSLLAAIGEAAAQK